MQHTLIAEFDEPRACANAIGVLRTQGIKRMEVYMPYPVKEIEEALRIRRSPLPWLVFAAGIVGACTAYFVLWYTNVHDYPLNVGGRPDHAVLAFVPITFETLILFAGCAAFFGALLLSGLPRLYHPIDELESFRLVSVDRFLLEVADAEPGAKSDEARAALHGAGALMVCNLDGKSPAQPQGEPAA